MINHKLGLDKFFQEILYRIHNWINEQSEWIFELIEFYRPLLGNFYIKLPPELRSPKKELIKIKNNDQKHFLWFHVGHINSIKIYPERITQKDKELVNDFNCDEVKFPISKEDFSKIEIKNVFGYENKLPFPINISDQKF